MRLYRLTVLALSCPFIAADMLKMRAMPGHRPAIVESPHHRHVGMRQLVEQHLVVDVIAVNVVQMDYVGTYLLDLLNQPPSCPN